MIDFFQFLLIVALVIIAIPTSLVCFELILSFLLARSQETTYNKTITISSVILIPAHNEELVLAETINSLKPQLTDKDNIVVVLDNCTDGTQRICETHDIDFVIRKNKELRGKSYALDYGLKSLGEKLPDVVVIVDADCDCKNLNLPSLKKQVFENEHIVQSRYDMLAYNGAKATTNVSAFAWYIKNHTRASGAKKLGIPCQIMGSGFALPRAAFEFINLDNGSIAEDLLLGLECSKHNYYPIYLPESSVSSFFPQQAKGANTQSTRWIHGHLDTIANYLGGYILTALKTGNMKLLLQSIDASFPPITFYFPLITFITVIALLTGVNIHILTILLLPTFLFIILLLIIWLFKARNILPPSQIFSVFKHLLLRVPKSLSFFRGKETNWVKTNREKKDLDE